MEFPRRALIVQRVLAVLMLTAAVGAALVERRSPLAARVREGKPWPFWVRGRVPGSAAPAFHLGVYDPVRRAVALIHVPGGTKLQGKLTVDRAYADALRASDDEKAAERAVEDLAEARVSELSLEPVSWKDAGRLAVTLGEGLELDPPESREYAVETARALKSLGRSPAALARMAAAAWRGLLEGDAAAADVLVLALELRRVPRENLAPAWLPSDAEAPAFLGRVLSAQAPAREERPIVVEVLNGTGESGLAAQASKILVSRGVDVIFKASSARSRLRTVVYDRTGDFERASRVRAALGCPTAIAATRIDPLRGVDASVELGGDCTF